MASIREYLYNVLIILAFSAAVGITLLVLGCALPMFNNNWWPLFVLIFYFLSPVPITIARRYGDRLDSASNAVMETCIFLTTGIVISAYGLPIILAHSTSIQWGACGFVMAGNTVIYLTIVGYFYFFTNDEIEYGMW